MDGFIEFLKILGVIFGVTALFFGCVIGIVTVSEQQFCKEMESIQPDFEFNWGFWGGCRVQTPSGYWVNAHDYQYIEGDVR